MSESAVIKLYAGAGYVLAEVTSASTAILKEISLNPEFGLGDMVLFFNMGKRNEISQVLRKASHTVFVRYATSLFFGDNFSRVKRHFEGNGFHTQHITSNIAGLAVPVGTDKDDFDIAFQTCPIECQVIETGEEEDEPDSFLY